MQRQGRGGADKSVHQGVPTAPDTGRGGKEPTLDSLHRAKSAEKWWAQPATFGSLQMVEGVGAWERAKQLPPFLCPSPPENEGSVALAAEEVWGGAGRGSHLGVTMLPRWGRTCVSPVGHLCSQGTKPSG